MTDKQISGIWTSIGSLSALYAINTFFVSRNPGSEGISNWFLIPAKNAESTSYWGGLIGLSFVAFLAWLATDYASRYATESLWWKRLPPTALEQQGHRSAIISKWSGILFLALPAVLSVLLALRAIFAPVVYWQSGEIVSSGGVVDRLLLVTNQCRWWQDQCFRLGNRDGIEYKPALTDGLLIIAATAAIVLTFRLFKALARKK